MKFDISSFLSDSKRVLSLAKKPTKEEFWGMSKVTALGILILGLVAYVVTTISFLLLK